VDEDFKLKIERKKREVDRREFGDGQGVDEKYFYRMPTRRKE